MKLYERFADKEFHTSIGTSFGIDFEAYESIALPRLRGAGCRNNVVIADSRMLTHALCGASALPRHAGRLYSVAGGSAPADGVFHPKLFLQLGRRRGRLIVSSANLTSPGLAGNLELAGTLACDETDSGERQLIAQAWQYLSRFITADQQALAAQRDWMLPRVPWLAGTIPAAGPVQLVDGTAAALLVPDGTAGIGERFAAFVGEPVSRLIVISPYWDMDLAALSFLSSRLSAQQTCILLDRDSATFPKHAPGKVPNLRLYNRGDFGKGRFIHAKAIIAETAAADHVLLGSANCTRAALGLSGAPGSNEEACLYRCLPPGTVADALALSALFTDDRRLDPAALPDLALEDDIPLDDLGALGPGRFECRVDVLIWRPSSEYAAPGAAILLFDPEGKPIPCRLDPLPGAAEGQRFQIADAQERPAFARVQLPDSRLSAPAIVALIDKLRAAVRETSSRKADNTLRQLDGETEATLQLLEVINEIEKLEQGAAAQPLSVPKTKKEKEEAPQDYRKLTYEQFIAGRRPRTAAQPAHSSLAGSDIAVVRTVLNRIVGLAAADDDHDDDRDPKVPEGAFNLGDETADAQKALGAGEEFDTEKTRREEEKRVSQRRAAVRKATKAQIVTAAGNFGERIRQRRESGTLDNHDIFRLRALLMVICTAALPDDGKSAEPRSRLQVLPSEGDQDSWPIVMGRTLFHIFGGNNPAVRTFYLSAEHDQIPADIVECWATCYWCLQACLIAPLSLQGRRRIAQYLSPLATRAYRLTLPTQEELLGDDVLSIMDSMSASYAVRVGTNQERMASAHRSSVKLLLGG